jgi:hypothetical protein
MPGMKPLILVLLLAISAEAQSLADYARHERLRREQMRASRTYTNDDARGLTVPEALKLEPVESEASSSAVSPTNAVSPVNNVTPARAATTTAPAAAAASTPPGAAAPQARPDPAQKYRQDTERLRAEIRTLQDQEVALQLQVNQLTNQFFAPVTDQASRNQAQAGLADMQGRLTALRGVLEQTRRTLAAMEAQGPPRE